jgi:DNA-binding NarL/FixJ family response regulator
MPPPPAIVTRPKRPGEPPGERARACRARIWNVIAQLLLGRSATANRVLAVLEGAATEQPPIVRDLIVAARALYVHLETGASHDQVATALVRLREHGAGGYALLLERLPLPTATAGGQFASLTKSELTILRAMARGGTSKVIAHSLSRSPQTVDTHVKAIVRKLGCRNRREAITRAVEAGIL